MSESMCATCGWGDHYTVDCPKREPLPVRPESDGWVCGDCMNAHWTSEEGIYHCIERDKKVNGGNWACSKLDIM